MSGRVAVQAPIDEELGELSALIGAIYDCAVAPELWPRVLGACCDFLDGYSVSLIVKHRGGNGGGIFYTDDRVEKQYQLSYFTTYASLDPTTGAHLLAPIETPISTADIMDVDELRETRFHLEWAAPQGLVDCAMVALDRTAEWTAMLSVLRHESAGLVDERCKARLRLLAPHIRRATLIGKVIEQRSFEVATLGDVLDGLAAGMFLVDANGHLVHANAAGQTVLERGGALTTRNGRLVGRDSQSTAELEALFQAAAAGDEALGTSGISVTLDDAQGERFVGHVLPLTAGARRRAGARYEAVAALFLHRATLDVPEPPEAIAKTYGLTLTELRVLMSIVHVGGVPETAAALGIAETTVKTHLGRVFGKTGVNRQADLVKLVAGFIGPLAH